MPPNSLHGHDESAIEKTAGSRADTLAPLAFVLLVTFGLGIFGGMLTNLLVAARLRRELLALKRELHAQRHAHAHVPVEAA